MFEIIKEIRCTFHFSFVFFNNMTNFLLQLRTILQIYRLKTLSIGTLLGSVPGTLSAFPLSMAGEIL